MKKSTKIIGTAGVVIAALEIGSVSGKATAMKLWEYYHPEEVEEVFEKLIDISKHKPISMARCKLIKQLMSKR